MSNRKPVRIQRKRTKGWRMPEGAVYVGRPTKWGNPFTPEEDPERILYRAHLRTKMARGLLNPEELRGHDLACWCRPGSPCHADVLLEIANAEPEADRRAPWEKQADAIAEALKGRP